MGFFGFGKKKEKEQQSAQAEETRLEAQADETSGAKNAQTAAGRMKKSRGFSAACGRGSPRRAETWPAAWMS